MIRSSTVTPSDAPKSVRKSKTKDTLERDEDMSFREEYLNNKLESERREKMEALLKSTVSHIAEAGLTVKETKIFYKILGNDLAEHQEQMLKTVPFLVLPDNLAELPCSDRRDFLLSRLSEVQKDRGQAHI